MKFKELHYGNKSKMITVVLIKRPSHNLGLILCLSVDIRSKPNIFRLEVILNVYKNNRRPFPQHLTQAWYIPTRGHFEF